MTVQIGVMTADQSLSTPDQWYTLASLTLNPGAWLISAVFQASFSGSDTVIGDIFDGTSGRAACERAVSGSVTDGIALNVAKLLSIPATSTVSVRARCAQGATTMVAHKTVGAGNQTDATQITATPVLSCAFEAELPWDINMINAAQWYDGPALDLSAGLWLVLSTTQFANLIGSGNCAPMVEIFDGTVGYCFNEYTGGVGETPQFSLAAAVPLADARTVRMRVATNVAGGARALARVAGEPGSRLIAVQVG